MEKDFGFVQDVCADLESGTITSIIVPGNNKLLSMFSASNDIVIEWQNIKKKAKITMRKCLIYIRKYVIIIKESKITKSFHKNLQKTTKMY